MPSLDLVGLIVSDMGASLAFYRELGLAFPLGSEGEGHVEATLPSGLRIALDTIDVIRSFDPDWNPPSGSPRMSLAFRCTSPSDVDSTYRRLVDLGYASHREPWDAFWGQRYATLHDPDGNSVDLFAPLAPQAIAEPPWPGGRNSSLARSYDGPGGSVADLSEEDLLVGFGE